MLVFQIMLTIVVADFVSGLFHWAEDAYGREDWPVLGALVTRPNILHHHEPRYFIRHNWWQSSWLLLGLGSAVVLGAWWLDLLTWQVWLFAILGVNANQFHKWAHQSPAENGKLIYLLQNARLLQTPHHHSQHHTNPKNSHYCVITNFLNPILDGIRLWEGFEVALRLLFGVHRRPDASLVKTTEPPEVHATAIPT